MKNNKNNQGGYGLLSVMAMIIGIVIGSGIFVKNQSLLGINGSVLDSLIAWVVGAIIVIAIVIAFLEIISITEITGEQATLSNWGRHLLGVRAGKTIGYYMAMVYFPLIIAGLLSFAAGQFYDTLALANPDLNDLNAGTHELIIVGIAFAAIMIVGIMNSLTTKPGKYLQNVGTVIKTIPLFFVILLFVILVFGNIDSISFANPENPIDVGDSVEGTMSPEYQSLAGNHFVLILMTIPAILFSFDGFLLAGALSKESKTPTTFKTAFIVSMIFIIAIYLLFSLAVFGLGTEDTEILTGIVNDPDAPAYGTINNAVYSGLDGLGIHSTSAKEGVAITVSSIIVLSIITGASGCFIASSRMMSDLSAHNSLVDKDKLLITKNKYGVSTASGFYTMAMIAMWFIIATSMDSIVISVAPADSTKPLTITGYMTDLIVIGAFLTYGILIVAAIVNRYKKDENQVKVNKNKAFLPAAYFAAILIFVVTVWFAFTSIAPFGFIMTGEAGDGYWTIYVAKLIFFILFILWTVFISVFNIIKSEQMSDDLINDKAEQVKVYYGDDNFDINEIEEHIHDGEIHNANSILEEEIIDEIIINGSSEKINKQYFKFLLSINKFLGNEVDAYLNKLKISKIHGIDKELEEFLIKELKINSIHDLKNLNLEKIKLKDLENMPVKHNYSNQAKLDLIKYYNKYSKELILNEK